MWGGRPRPRIVQMSPAPWPGLGRDQGGRARVRGPTPLYGNPETALVGPENRARRTEARTTRVRSTGTRTTGARKKG